MKIVCVVAALLLTLTPPSEASSKQPKPSVAPSAPEYIASFDASLSYAAYANTVRFWGIVGEVVITTETDGDVWGYFTLYGPDGIIARLDCGYETDTLGCDLLEPGQSVLVNGHVAARLAGSCEPDGVLNFLVPNVIYSCQGTTPQTLSGPCTAVTPDPEDE